MGFTSCAQSAGMKKSLHLRIYSYLKDEGLSFRVTTLFAGYIFPRSGLSAKGIVCELPPIDSGYTGEVHTIISNVGREKYEIKAGDKIGQLVIMPVLIPDFTFEEWKERGTGAFGSTGR